MRLRIRDQGRAWPNVRSFRCSSCIGGRCSVYFSAHWHQRELTNWSHTADEESEQTNAVFTMRLMGQWLSYISAMFTLYSHGVSRTIYSWAPLRQNSVGSNREPCCISHLCLHYLRQLKRSEVRCRQDIILSRLDWTTATQCLLVFRGGHSLHHSMSQNAALLRHDLSQFLRLTPWTVTFKCCLKLNHISTYILAAALDCLSYYLDFCFARSASDVSVYFFMALILSRNMTESSRYCHVSFYCA